MRRRALHPPSFRPHLCGYLAVLLAVGGVFGGDLRTSAGADPVPGVAEEKASRTPVEEKMDSSLIMAGKEARGEAVPQGAKQVLKPDAEGRVLVDIKADVSAALLEQIAKLGGAVHSQFPGQHAIRASVPAAKLKELAAEPTIQFIRAAVPARPTGAGRDPASKP